tara:strand:+ start:673 stop:834 length:162 start_codon:yes stop_codon:yes gene_type:complete
MKEWPQELPDVETQDREIKAQRKNIRNQMKETDKQTEALLDSEYFLFFGEANK